MKKLLSVAVACLSITTATLAKNDVAIKGTITNRLSDSVIISFADYGDNWLDFNMSVSYITLDKNGNFLATLDIPHDNTLVQIQNGEQATELFVSAGDKLRMTVNAQDFDASLDYEGIGMKPVVANFMAKHVLTQGMTRSFQISAQQLMAKEPKEFGEEIGKMTQKELDFLIENGKNLPVSFVEFWNAYFTYSKYAAMMMYPQMHEVIKKRSYDIAEVPAENYEVFKAVPERFDDKFLSISEYRNYVSGYYATRLAAEGVKAEAGNATFITDKMLELSRKKMPNLSKQFVFAYSIYGNLKNTPIARTEEQLDKFNQLYPGNDYNKFLEKQLAFKKRLAVGSPAIDFTVTDAEGKKVKLSDLKGKVVYLDFWASWCGPCKAQFPHTKKVKEHFAGKDVAFVYVSIDEDAEAWEKAMKQYELTGLHTRVDGWKDKLAEDYGVHSIPAYFVIDKEGKFAAEKTPRPSQTEELIKTIEALL